MKIAGYETHPAADLFPLLEGQELQDLANDVKANGLLNPVTLYVDGGNRLVLDGRNRLRACEMVGVAPSFEFWAGEGSPTTWVVSQNLRRRHLTPSQASMVGAALVKLFEDETRPGARSDLGQNFGRGRSAERAAEAVNVSDESIRHAQRVTERGATELADAVRQGRVSVSTAAVLTEAPLDEQREIVARGAPEILRKAKELRQALLLKRREARTDKIATIAAGNEPIGGVKPCPVVYADPPWEYENTASAGAVVDQYPTMPLDDICALRPPATDDAILFLWATSPLLLAGLKVIESWGFTYKGSMVWDKGSGGMGSWVANGHELLLIATRGDIPPPSPDRRPPSVIRVPRGKHSAKPDEFALAIERMYPTLPRIEMFARGPRVNWTVWGNQAA